MLQGIPAGGVPRNPLPLAGVSAETFHPSNPCSGCRRTPRIALSARFNLHHTQHSHQPHSARCSNGQLRAKDHKRPGAWLPSRNSSEGLTTGTVAPGAEPLHNGAPLLHLPLSATSNPRSGPALASIGSVALVAPCSMMSWPSPEPQRPHPMASPPCQPGLRRPLSPPRYPIFTSSRGHSPAQSV